MKFPNWDFGRTIVIPVIGRSACFRARSIRVGHVNAFYVVDYRLVVVVASIVSHHS